MGLRSLLHLEGIMKKFEWVDELFNGWQAPSGEMMQTMTAEQQKIVKRLKGRSYEMQLVYEEIERKVNRDLGRREVLRACIDAAVVYENKQDMKDDKKDLETFQKDISKKAKEMIGLLNSYTRVIEEGLLFSEANTDPLYLLMEAGQNTGPYERKDSFKNHAFPVLKEFSPLGGKYMPNLQDVLSMLVYEMDNNPVIGTSSEIDVVMDSQKTDYPDFVRGFMDCIDQVKQGYNLPGKFKLTDGNMAAMAACALGMKAINDDSVRKARKR